MRVGDKAREMLAGGVTGAEQRLQEQHKQLLVVWQLLKAGKGVDV